MFIPWSWNVRSTKVLRAMWCSQKKNKKRQSWNTNLCYGASSVKTKVKRLLKACFRVCLKFYKPLYITGIFFTILKHNQYICNLVFLLTCCAIDVSDFLA